METCVVLLVRFVKIHSKYLHASCSVNCILHCFFPVVMSVLLLHTLLRDIRRQSYLCNYGSHANRILPDLPQPRKSLCVHCVIYVNVTMVESTHVTSPPRNRTIFNFISILCSWMQVDLRRVSYLSEERRASMFRIRDFLLFMDSLTLKV